jgi:hypothetical protein
VSQIIRKQKESLVGEPNHTNTKKVWWVSQIIQKQKKVQYVSRIIRKQTISLVGEPNHAKAVKSLVSEPNHKKQKKFSR